MDEVLASYRAHSISVNESAQSPKIPHLQVQVIYFRRSGHLNGEKAKAKERIETNTTEMDDERFHVDASGANNYYSSGGRAIVSVKTT